VLLNNKYRTNTGLLLILLSFFSLKGCEQYDYNSQFYLLSGEQKALSDYRGEWLLINFWAEWCRPCLEEIPDLNQLHQKKDALNLSVLAVSYEPEANERLLSAKQRFNMEYPMMATDPEPRVPFTRPNKLPAFYLVTPQGEITGPFYGKESLREVEQRIQATE